MWSRLFRAWPRRRGSPQRRLQSRPVIRVKRRTPWEHSGVRDGGTWPPDQRGFGDFLRAVRTAPAFRFRVLMTVAFASSLVVTKGIGTALSAVLVGLSVGVLIGYPLFRRSGNVP
jgi:hypothetical protein